MFGGEASPLPPPLDRTLPVVDDRALTKQSYHPLNMQLLLLEMLLAVAVDRTTEWRTSCKLILQLLVNPAFNNESKIFNSSGLDVIGS